MKDIKAGDFIDVRMVAVAVVGNRVTARLPSESATHQVVVGSYQVQNVTPREPAAIAADIVCSSYDGIAPIQDRRARSTKR